MNTSGTGTPYPFNGTIDSAAYLGFEKLLSDKSLADYIKVTVSVL